MSKLFVKHLSILFLSSVLISCYDKNIVKNESVDIPGRPFCEWSLEECRQARNKFTINNSRNVITSSGVVQIHSAELFIELTLFTPEVIMANVREDAILKRLSKESLLANYKYQLEYYTNFIYDIEKDTVINNPGISNDSLSGITFKIHFENRTDPYRQITVKDGYEYIFLENKAGEFSRVIEIGGLFAEQNIYINDFLDVEVTFSAYNDEGKLLFENQKLFDGFKVVFNKLLDEPIIISFNTR